VITIYGTVTVIYITTLSMCAVPNMAVFCSSLMSCLPIVFVRYYMNNLEKVPVALIITGTLQLLLLLLLLLLRCIIRFFANIGVRIQKWACMYVHSSGRMSLDMSVLLLGAKLKF
jgi:hypothetical protein